MKIELDAENSAALTRYAALAGHSPTEFLNRYLSDNMIALFENRRSGELEGYLCGLEYRTCLLYTSDAADAEHAIAWIEQRVAERSHGAYWFEAGIFQDPETGHFWINATVTANGLTHSV